MVLPWLSLIRPKRDGKTLKSHGGSVRGNRLGNSHFLRGFHWTKQAPKQPESKQATLSGRAKLMLSESARQTMIFLVCVQKGAPEIWTSIESKLKRAPARKTHRFGTNI